MHFVRVDEELPAQNLSLKNFLVDIGEGRTI
jgi:hypothetical protein